jgi:hypothetical protein
MVAGLAIVLSSMFAHAAAPTPGTTSLVSSPLNPVPLTSINDVTLTSTTTDYETRTLIPVGKVTFQRATDGSGNPVPANAVAVDDDWVDLTPNNQALDGRGQFSIGVDLGVLGFSASRPGRRAAFARTTCPAAKVAPKFCHTTVIPSISLSPTT